MLSILQTILHVLTIFAVGTLIGLVAMFMFYAAIWIFWCARGKNVLFVYSDSPTWSEYLRARVLPQIAHKAVILNWSDRRKWKLSLASVAFKHFGGLSEFCPLAVVFRPWRKAHVFRFLKPFKDFKHGNDRALKKLEAEFFRALEK